jgi:hypothetical protein
VLDDQDWRGGRLGGAHRPLRYGGDRQNVPLVPDGELATAVLGGGRDIQTPAQFTAYMHRQSPHPIKEPTAPMVGGSELAGRLLPPHDVSEVSLLIPRYWITERGRHPAALAPAGRFYHLADAGCGHADDLPAAVHHGPAAAGPWRAAEPCGRGGEDGPGHGVALGRLGRTSPAERPRKA